MSRIKRSLLPAMAAVACLALASLAAAHTPPVLKKCCDRWQMKSPSGPGGFSITDVIFDKATDSTVRIKGTDGTTTDDRTYNYGSTAAGEAKCRGAAGLAGVPLVDWNPTNKTLSLTLTTATTGSTCTTANNGSATLKEFTRSGNFEVTFDPAAGNDCKVRFPNAGTAEWMQVAAAAASQDAAATSYTFPSGTNFTVKLTFTLP